MRSDPRSSSWRVAGGLALAGLVAGCGAPDESLARSTAHLDSYIFERRQEPLIAHDAKAFDEFGTAIGISSRWAAVGSPGADFTDDPIDDTGSATLFERKQGNSWEEVGTLRPPQSWPDARFGTTVAATDKVIALGAPEADPSNVGATVFAGLVATFVYRDGAWAPEPLLHDPAEGELRAFGSALAMDDRTLLVGAQGGDQVFAFPRTATGWGEPFTIEAPGGAGTAFGFSLALDDPYAFVGAPFDDGKASPPREDQGSVFVFKREGDQWLPQGELERNFINANDQFGAAVAARKGLAVATSYGDGSVVFAQLDASSHWGDSFKASSGDAASTSGFGWSLAIGARASVWVGAFQDSNWSGAVYPFVHTDEGNWQIKPALSFEDGGWFGYSVASATGALMVGAPAADPDSRGAVYVIETSDGSTCVEDGDCFSEHCVSGICCNSRCDEPCYSCLAAEKIGDGADGTCEPRRAGYRDEACSDAGAQSCGTNGLCDGEGNCARYAQGTQCGEPFCSGNDLVGASLCDGRGDCEAPAATDCLNYACRDGACQDACASDADCDQRMYCNDARCRPKLGLGAGCSADEACLQGHCADGVCCDQACDGKCEACAEPGSVGSCVPLNAGSPPRVEVAQNAAPIQACSQLFCDGVERSLATMPADGRVTCAPAGCEDGREVGEGRCDGAGQCEIPTLKSCGAYACSSGAAATGRPAQCLSSCQTVDDCAADFYCTTDQECRPIEPSEGQSRGCGVTGAGRSDVSSCFLLTSAIAVLSLRRRRPSRRKIDAP